MNVFDVLTVSGQRKSMPAASMFSKTASALSLMSEDSFIDIMTRFGEFPTLN
jgi:hypothetical protein